MNTAIATQNFVPVNLTQGLKIFITGDPGAGKSTTATALRDCLGLPLFHLDKHVYKAFPKKFPTKYFKSAIDFFMETNRSFIIDGCTFGNEGLEQFEKIATAADVIINFEVTPQASLDGLFKRMDDLGNGISAKGWVEVKGSLTDFLQLWLKWYVGYLGRKDAYTKVLYTMPEKIVTIKSFAEADKIIEYYKNLYSKTGF